MARVRDNLIGNGSLNVNGVVEAYKVKRGDTINVSDFVQFVNEAADTIEKSTEVSTVNNRYITEADSTSNSLPYVSNAMKAVKISDSLLILIYRHYTSVSDISIRAIALTIGSDNSFTTSSVYYIANLSSTSDVFDALEVNGNVCVVHSYGSPISSIYMNTVVITTSGSTVTLTSRSYDFTVNFDTSLYSTFAPTKLRIVKSDESSTSTSYTGTLYVAGLFRTISTSTGILSYWVRGTAVSLYNQGTNYMFTNISGTTMSAQPSTTNYYHGFDMICMPDRHRIDIVYHSSSTSLGANVLRLTETSFSNYVRNLSELDSYLPESPSGAISKHPIYIRPLDSTRNILVLTTTQTVVLAVYQCTGLSTYVIEDIETIFTNSATGYNVHMANVYPMAYQPTEGVFEMNAVIQLVSSTLVSEYDLRFPIISSNGSIITEKTYLTTTTGQVINKWFDYANSGTRSIEFDAIAIGDTMDVGIYAAATPGIDTDTADYIMHIHAHLPTINNNTITERIDKGMISKLTNYSIISDRGANNLKAIEIYTDTFLVMYVSNFRNYLVYTIMTKTGNTYTLSKEHYISYKSTSEFDVVKVNETNLVMIYSNSDETRLLHYKIVGGKTLAADTTSENTELPANLSNISMYRDESTSYNVLISYNTSSYGLLATYNPIDNEVNETASGSYKSNTLCINYSAGRWFKFCKDTSGLRCTPFITTAAKVEDTTPITNIDADCNGYSTLSTLARATDTEMLVGLMTAGADMYIGRYRIDSNTAVTKTASLVVTSAYTGSAYPSNLRLLALDETHYIMSYNVNKLIYMNILSIENDGAIEKESDTDYLLTGNLYNAFENFKIMKLGNNRISLIVNIGTLAKTTLASVNFEISLSDKSTVITNGNVSDAFDGIAQSSGVGGDYINVYFPHM